MTRLDSLGLSDAEWINVTYRLRGRPEPWACDLALKLSEHPDPSVRMNAIRALGDWARPDARAAIAKALRSRVEPVRFAAIDATESRGFSGSMDELDGLLECASGAGTTVSVAASEALESLVADALLPPAVGLFGRRDWSRLLAGGRTSIRWDPSTRRFVADVPR